MKRSKRPGTRGEVPHRQRDTTRQQGVSTGSGGSSHRPWHPPSSLLGTQHLWPLLPPSEQPGEPRSLEDSAQLLLAPPHLPPAPTPRSQGLRVGPVSPSFARLPPPCSMIPNETERAWQPLRAFAAPWVNPQGAPPWFSPWRPLRPWGVEVNHQDCVLGSHHTAETSDQTPEQRHSVIPPPPGLRPFHSRWEFFSKNEKGLPFTEQLFRSQAWPAAFNRRPPGQDHY